MDNHHFILKLSRLFPSSFSSCHIRTLPDVADTKILHENDPSSPFTKSKITKYSSRLPTICKSSPVSDAQGRKCPPATPVSPKKINPGRSHVQVASSASVVSSNSGWFTSSDEKTRRDEDVESETFFSISSNSGDSFRLKASRRFKRCEEMKSIDETGHCSFSSAASFDAVPNRKAAAAISKTAAKRTLKSDRSQSKIRREKTELGSDHISTQLYYSSGDSRRRKSRRKMKSRRIPDGRSVMGESYAVEKRSEDPRSDFRASMVEMIVEKQIFAAEDLERLLLCFLSLNAASYHGVIYEVFNEICQTLFAN